MCAISQMGNKLSVRYHILPQGFHSLQSKAGGLFVQQNAQVKNNGKSEIANYWFFLEKPTGDMWLNLLTKGQ